MQAANPGSGPTSGDGNKAAHSNTLPPRVIRVDDVLRELRRRVQQARELADAPGSLAAQGLRSGAEDPGSPGLTRLPRRTEFAVKEEFSLRDFLDHHDESFVYNAYRGLLGRDPDVDGSVYYLNALRSGAFGKIEALGRIRYSKEGRHHAVRVSGLLLPYLMQRLYGVPVIGYLARLPIALVRLPRSATQAGKLEAYVNHRLDVLADHMNRTLGEIEASLLEVQTSVAIRIDSLRGATPAPDRIEEIAIRASRAAARSSLDEFSTALDVLNRSKAGVEALDAIRSRLRATASHSSLEALSKRVGELSQEKADRAGLKALDQLVRDAAPRRRLDDLSLRLDELAGRKADAASVSKLAERFTAATRELEGMSARMHEAEHRHDSMQSTTSQAEQRIAAIEARLSAVEEPRADAHAHDAMYAALEDRFRGTSDEVKERLLAYLPTVREVMRVNSHAGVIDLGCGRGEWLELMRQEGWPAVGIDVNRVMVTRCLEAGLGVVEGDAIEYLREQAPGSTAVVSGFHILEHLGFDDLVAVLDESFRVLQVGGVAIFETPNPENLLVGAFHFYADPTHHHPLVPPTMQFLLEQRGFVDVEIVRPRPGDPEWMRNLEPGDPLAPRLNPILEALRSWFDPSPDFAIVGRKE